MKIDYFEDTDSVLMTFRDGATYDDSEEIFDGFVVDLDETGRPMGLDIEQASKVFDLEWLRRHAYQKEEAVLGSIIRDAPMKDEG
jgi:uncharacterized protein YuzE